MSFWLNINHVWFDMLSGFSMHKNACHMQYFVNFHNFPTESMVLFNTMLYIMKYFWCNKPTYGKFNMCSMLCITSAMP